MRLLLILSFPCCFYAQPPQIPELAQQVITNELRHGKEYEEFTFEFESIFQRFDSKGKQVGKLVETGESYMSHRRNIDIALTRNGKPLKPKDLDKRQAAARRRLEDDAKQRQAADYKEVPLDNRPGPGMEIYKVRMSVVDVLRYCQLSEASKATHLELDFANCKSPWPAEEHYTQLRGTVRIDSKTILVDSWQAFVTSGPKAGALFFEQNTQVAAGGTRVLALNHLNLSIAPHVFPKDRIEVFYRWTKPQRFGVQVEQKIEAPRP